jgi:hypothetical protein
MPDERLTPIASRMTIRAKKRARMKMLVSGPSTKPIAVTRETARALWLEGMPPVFQKKVVRTSLKEWERYLKRLTIALMNCAVRRLKTAERKTGFRKRSPPPECIAEFIEKVSPEPPHLVKTWM